MWVESHSRRTLSTFLCSAYDAKPLHMYGFYLGNIIPYHIPSLESINTPDSSTHAFHSDEGILEASNSPDHLWGNMIHHSSFFTLGNSHPFQPL